MKDFKKHIPMAQTRRLGTFSSSPGHLGLKPQMSSSLLLLLLLLEAADAFGRVIMVVVVAKDDR
jgi:hypothetical protein